SQRRRRRFHSCDEEVGASPHQVDVVKILILSHPLFVSVHEAGRFIFDLVVLQHLLDVLTEVLVELNPGCLNFSNGVRSDDRPISDARKDQGEQYAEVIGHFVYHLAEAVDIVHQWLAVIIVVPVPEENLIDDVGNHDLQWPSKIHVLLIFNRLKKGNVFCDRSANLFFHHISAHSEVAHDGNRCSSIFPPNSTVRVDHTSSVSFFLFFYRIFA
ncbi:hypothetical protein PMAYCL1PPCAC_08747, partial [Pristionchus mayeri]